MSRADEAGFLTVPSDFLLLMDRKLRLGCVSDRRGIRSPPGDWTGWNCNQFSLHPANPAPGAIQTILALNLLFYI